MSNNIHQTSGRGRAIIIFTDKTHIQVDYTRHPGTRGTHTITISDNKTPILIQNKTKQYKNSHQQQKTSQYPKIR